LDDRLINKTRYDFGNPQWVIVYEGISKTRGRPKKMILSAVAEKALEKTCHANKKSLGAIDLNS